MNMSRPTSFHLRTQSRPNSQALKGLSSILDQAKHSDIIPLETSSDAVPEVSEHLISYLLIINNTNFCDFNMVYLSNLFLFIKLCYN
jgi:hypothetical protein